MLKWNNVNTLFIMASKGYARKTIEEKGIRAVSPYFGDNGFLRILREICFRIFFLPKVQWYNKSFLDENYKFIIIIDVNITRHYLKWIIKKFPEAQINFLYDNMVGMARNISPKKIPDTIRVWTYDDYDARKYNIFLQKNYWVREMIFQQRKTPIYDVFFVGRDKGRRQKLLELEKELQEMGLKTKFIITKNGKLSREKSYYQKPISYEQVIEYDTQSRSILNIVMENQEGVTMRDMESIAIGVKLITTNRNIINKDCYNKNNIFILGMDDLRNLPDFLNKKFIDVWKDIKDRHTFDAMLDELTGYKNMDTENA